MKKEFTIAYAYKVQEENLLKWSMVLNTDAYNKLLQKVKDGNIGVNSAHQVPRGQDIDTYVHEIANEMLNQ
jgi:hypothetical protein